MRARSMGLPALTLSLAALAPAATIVNFDTLVASSGGLVTPGGVTPFVGQTVPSNYSPFVTFSVPTGGLYLYAEGGMWPDNPPASVPNVVCPTTVALASSAMCTEPLHVTFSQPVNALSFWTGAWDDVGSLMVIEIFTGNNVFTGQIQVTSPQRLNTQGVIDVSGLSGIADITGLRILSPSSSLQSGAGDRNGLVFDTFVFDGPAPPPGPPPPSVPEPSAIGLAAIGLVAVICRRLRS